MKLILTLIAVTSSFVLHPAVFAAPPLIPAPVAPAERTLADKQADAAKRIDHGLLQLQQAIKFGVQNLQREIDHNRDGLTREQVLAALGEKAAPLAKAQADLVALAEKYAPGTFAAPPVPTPAPASVSAKPAVKPPVK